MPPQRRGGHLLDSSGTSVPQTNLRDSVASAVRQMIFNGSVRAGEKLNQDALAESLGVSKLPVREALLVLHEEGIVDILPRRGAFVADLDADDVLAHFQIIGAIARLAAERAANRITPDTLATLRRIHTDIESTTDPHRMSVLNYEFHAVINRHCGSQLLLKEITSLAKRLPPEMFETAEWPAIASREHAAILGALELQDTNLTGALMEMHLRSSGTHIANRLAKTGFFAHLSPDDQAALALAEAASARGDEGIAESV